MLELEVLPECSLRNDQVEFVLVAYPERSEGAVCPRHQAEWVAKSMEYHYYSPDNCI